MTAADRNRALLDWYDLNRRSLPWRGTSEPWPLLVSEIMSQQTQVSRVVPRWLVFMEAYPTPGDLAKADRGELIRLWAGLGYQRRAFNLQRAAASIDANGWPQNASELQRLPGIGPYTAAAVACFAFGEAVPAIDTNLRRVVSRWRGTALSGNTLEAAAAAELQADRPGDWNQAVMDLGAEMCLTREPECSRCPVSSWCIDPGVYQPPPRQSRYEGSRRQARAAVLRALAEVESSDITELALAHNLDPVTVESAVDSLINEGLISRDGAGRLSLA